VKIDFETEEDARGVSNFGLGCIQCPIMFFAKGEKIAVSLEKVGESASTLSVVVNVCGCAQVSLVGQGHEGCGSVGASDGTCIHFPEDHACRFDEAEGCVDSEEFTGGAGA
jgi:hypothetical protein